VKCRCLTCNGTRGYPLSCRRTYCWTFNSCFEDLIDRNFTISEVVRLNTIREVAMIDE
jgi:hypothetical protein